MIVVLMLGVINFLISRLRGPSDSYRYWTAGNFLLAIGFTLLGLRGNIPMFWSAVTGNTLLIVAMVAFYEGLRRFFGLRGFSGLSIALVVIGLAGELYLLYGYNNLNARAVLFAAFAAVMAVSCVALIARIGPRETRSATLFTAAFWVLMAGMMVFRAIYLLVYDPLQSLFQDDPVQTITFVGVIVSACGWNFGFLLMASQKMEADLRAAQADLERLSITDSLTGTYNRRHLYNLGEHELATARRYDRPFALILMDADLFKKVNDAFGHLTGDAALIHLTETIQKNLRAADVLGRFGGEEFAVLLPETDLQAARQTADRLRELIGQIRVEQAPGLAFTVSMGVTARQADDRVLDDLIRRADRALYLAKASGRNRVEISSMV